MNVTAKTAAWVGLMIEAAAFLRCLVETVRLTFFASTATMLLKSAQPYFLGMLAALGYLVATIVVFRNGKFALSSILAIAMVVVLVALKLAFL
ncbi:MAG TPA: hypothetical protein VLV88_10735 [Terriglobales bacterium]|nr:hypothetical protein [Terriglobales bacterium]